VYPRENVESLLKDPPQSSDDPRLQHWYHTIELAEGIVSTGTYDLRSVVDSHGLPPSLAGKSALDVGTADGFWAFELERRGADPVVAIDIANWGEFDWLPWIKSQKGDFLVESPERRFECARSMRGSAVERRVCSVYDLSPDTVGTFDVTFCGSLLLHLQNPIKAVVNIRSVTREMAIVASLVDVELEEQATGRPWLMFGHRKAETNNGKPIGDSCIYWRFSTPGLQELMDYCGFDRTEPLEPFGMPPTGNLCGAVIGYVDDPDAPPRALPG
jgi:tRNA (mo5U34)-methyltransferase